MKLTQFANHYCRLLLPLCFWSLLAQICDAVKTHHHLKPLIGKMGIVSRNTLSGKQHGTIVTQNNIIHRRSCQESQEIGSEVNQGMWIKILFWEFFIW